MLNIWQIAKETFTTPQDQELLARTEDRARALSEIAGLMEDPRAESVRTLIKEELAEALRKLLETREDKYISDVKAYINLLGKLSAKTELESLEKWVEERVEESNG